MSKAVENRKKLNDFVKKNGSKAEKRLDKFTKKIGANNSVTYSISKDTLFEYVVSEAEMENVGCKHTVREVVDLLGINVLAIDREYDEETGKFLDSVTGLTQDKSSVCFLSDTVLTWLPSYVKRVKLDKMSKLHWAMSGVNIED